MARRRTIADRDRDARAVELRRRNLNYKQIAAEMGYASQSSAYEAVQRGLADTQAETNDEVRRMELERLDDLARSALRVLATKHYAIAPGGKLARHPETGEPLADDGPVLQAIDRLLKIQERRAKLLGLDAPARTRIEIIDDDIAQQLVAQLEAELAALTADAGGGVPADPPADR